MLVLFWVLFRYCEYRFALYRTVPIALVGTVGTAGTVGTVGTVGIIVLWVL